MQYSIFKLKFRTPLHIGDVRPNYESCEGFVHSDTLFSALMNAWRLLYPEDLALFFPADHPDSVPFPYFRISSAFPYAGSDIFFPKPCFNPPRLKREEAGDAKVFKKLIWIAKPYFENWVKGESVKIDPEYLSPDKRFLFSMRVPRGADNPVAVQDSPRVRKDRETEQTDIFYYARLYFAENAGLYFLATFQNIEWRNKFKAVLNLLGDEGLGGDRSVGNGHFEIDQKEMAIDLRLPENSKHFLTLALYHPQTNELALNMQNAYYDLTNRSGWVYSGRGRSLRRNNVRMFTEGSVFSDSPGDYGDVVKVLEPLPDYGLEHAVYRYGKAFCLPVNLPEVLS